MTEFSGLFTRRDLIFEIGEGYVRTQSHPDDVTLKIANYTEKAQYAKRWNAVTLNCRGLIYNEQTGEVVARPFPKFFNYGEYENGLDLEARVEVVDKMDGSLGITYMAPDGEYAIATRGSFASDQAIFGTEILRKQYLPHWQPCPVCTQLFEIIYPENRIVVDYGPIRDLIYLGSVHLETGDVEGPSVHSGDLPRADVMSASTLSEALALPPRKNAEGVVVRYLESGLQVKIKQDDYVALHKIVTGLNERAVWEHMSENDGSYEGLLATVPDEFQEWVTKVGIELHHKYDEISGRAHDAFVNLDAPHWVITDMRVGEGRKHFALYVREQHPELAPYLFSLLDGKDIAPAIWKAIRPAGERPYQYDREEIAA